MCFCVLVIIIFSNEINNFYTIVCFKFKKVDGNMKMKVILKVGANCLKE